MTRRHMPMTRRHIALVLATMVPWFPAAVAEATSMGTGSQSIPNATLIQHRPVPLCAKHIPAVRGQWPLPTLLRCRCLPGPTQVFG